MKSKGFSDADWKEMKVRYDTYCGLNCGACPVGLANEREDENTLKSMAEQWGVQREEVNCTGCKTQTIAPFCARCEMRVCAREKGLEFCSQCIDFPCRTITAFKNDKAPHHSPILKNLEEIEKEGIEAWLKKEEKRWSCSGCGARFTWYNETCSECGEELFDAVKEEKDLQ